MLIPKLSLLALLALFVSATSPSSAGQMNFAGPPQGQDLDPWLVSHTCYNARARVTSRRDAPDTYSFRAFNYAPGALGSSLPFEHPSYLTKVIGGGAVVVNGTAFPFTWDKRLRQFVATATFPTSGSGHVIQVVVMDTGGSVILQDAWTGVTVIP